MELHRGGEKKKRKKRSSWQSWKIRLKSSLSRSGSLLAHAAPRHLWRTVGRGQQGHPHVPQVRPRCPSAPPVTEETKPCLRLSSLRNSWAPQERRITYQRLSQQKVRWKRVTSSPRLCNTSDSPRSWAFLLLMAFQWPRYPNTSREFCIFLICP